MSYYPEQKPKKSYHLIDEYGHKVGHTYKSASAYAAATKAASAGYEDITLYEPESGTVYNYAGTSVDVPEHKRTNFMREHDIYKKPLVKSLGHQKIV